MHRNPISVSFKMGWQKLWQTGESGYLSYNILTLPNLTTILQGQNMKRELVKHWMSKEVIVVRQNSSLPEAHQIMLFNNIRRLPVTNENGRLVGMITLSDVRSASPSQATSVSIFEMNYLLSSLAVERVMASNPATIHPQQTINEAAKLMLQKRISGLPVVDKDDQICGIITESDIFRMVVLHEWGDESHTPKDGL